ncbi:VOC family protein [Dokdonella sp.]|uniref:VOC family protein n=1 Tax=Dokdonella sp. TaxID=2291710 RepID=UPI0035276D7C
MKTNPVVWFEIYVQDMKRAVSFYENVLGVRLAQLEGPGIEMWTFPRSLELHGAAGALVKAEGVPSGGNSTLVYFGCEDCAVGASRVTENGGTMVKEKFSIGEHGFVALVKDSEGNMAGLHSMK